MIATISAAMPMIPNKRSRSSRTPSPNSADIWVPKILVIDDDPMFCYAFQRFARLRQVPVNTFDSFGDFEKERNWSYDMVIMDYDLGSLDGVEFAEYIEDTIGYVPTLMISSTDRQQDYDSPWPEIIEGFSNKKKGLDNIFDDAIRTYAIGRMRRKDRFFR
jgi:CheY-like chemotaxis protein